MCRDLEDNTLVSFLPAKEIENHLSSGALEKLGQDDEIVLGDGRALNFVITKSKLVTNITDWSQVMHVDNDQFEMISQEMTNQLFCGPRPKGRARLRNRLHKFFSLD